MSDGNPEDPELDELLGAYALDAIDDEERLVLDSYLARSARARAEVDEHLEVASFLGNIGGEAPRHLWDIIAAQIDGPPAGARPSLTLVLGDAKPGGPPTDANRPSSGTQAAHARRVRRGWVTGIAAVAAAVIAVLGITVARQNHRIDTLAAASSPIDRRVNELLSSKDTREAKLVSPDGKTRVTALLGANGEGYVVGGQLPTLPPGRVYQLWGIKGTQVISLGVLGRDVATRAFAADEGWNTLAITDEEAPGVTETTQKPVVAGALV